MDSFFSLMFSLSCAEVTFVVYFRNSMSSSFASLRFCYNSVRSFLDKTLPLRFPAADHFPRTTVCSSLRLLFQIDPLKYSGRMNAENAGYLVDHVNRCLAIHLFDQKSIFREFFKSRLNSCFRHSLRVIQEDVVVWIWAVLFFHIVVNCSLPMFFYFWFKSIWWLNLKLNFEPVPEIFSIPALTVFPAFLDELAFPEDGVAFAFALLFAAFLAFDGGLSVFPITSFKKTIFFQTN